MALLREGSRVSEDAGPGQLLMNDPAEEALTWLTRQGWVPELTLWVTELLRLFWAGVLESLMRLFLVLFL